MRFFEELGLTILDGWRRADFDSAAFPGIAAEALSKRPPSREIEPIDIIRWVHEAPFLVPQADIEASFGQPPITVFRCEHFYIDVLFWVDGTTAVHQHRFSGAFQVMKGASIHSTHRFRVAHRFNERLMAGTLERMSLELLSQGDVRPIAAGAGFVHSLFHLDRPSASVVVRTPTDALAGLQYSYSRAGIAFDPFTKSESTVRIMQTMDFLSSTAHRDFESLAKNAIQKSDPFVAFTLLSHLRKKFTSHERYLAFLDGILPAHQPLIEIARRDAREQWREEYIISRRLLVEEPELRFFLALLLNVPDRAGLRDLVRASFPGDEPTVKIVGWLRALSKLDDIHRWVGSASGIEEHESKRILDVPIDDLSVEVLRLLLEDLEEDSITSQLSSRSGATSPGGPTRRDVSRCYAELRRSRLLGALLS